jgi:hypothetical protein
MDLIRQVVREVMEERSFSDKSVSPSNIDMDLIRQAVREVIEECWGRPEAAKFVKEARGHRRGDDDRSDGRAPGREREGTGQKRSSGGRGRSLSNRRSY